MNYIHTLSMTQFQIIFDKQTQRYIAKWIDKTFYEIILLVGT